MSHGGLQLEGSLEQRRKGQSSHILTFIKLEQYSRYRQINLNFGCSTLTSRRTKNYSWDPLADSTRIIVRSVPSARHEKTRTESKERGLCHHNRRSKHYSQILDSHQRNQISRIRETSTDNYCSHRGQQIVISTPHRIKLSIS